MRQSREVAEETRRRIVRTAAEQFRRHGIAGIGIADVMKEAGLTHGGFYKHFPSKEALAGEAAGWALAATRDELIKAVEKAPEGRGLEALVKNYLSMSHRDNPERGCSIAALGIEAARGDGPARDALVGGYQRLVARVASLIEGRPPAETSRLAISIVSTMVGALSVARLLEDRAAAEEVLRAATKSILSEAGPKP